MIFIFYFFSGKLLNFDFVRVLFIFLLVTESITPLIKSSRISKTFHILSDRVVSAFPSKLNLF